MDRFGTNGLDLACESVGDAGRPAMLPISGPGAQMIRRIGDFCTALAARGYRVIRYDNRDAGLSTHLDTPSIDPAMSSAGR